MGLVWAIRTEMLTRRYSCFIWRIPSSMVTEDCGDARGIGLRAGQLQNPRIEYCSVEERIPSLTVRVRLGNAGPAQTEPRL